MGLSVGAEVAVIDGACWPGGQVASEHHQLSLVYAIWCTVLTSVGYSLGSSCKHAVKAFSYAGYLAAALVVIAVAVLFVHRLRQVREDLRQGCGA
jgi:hypothetical protein